MQVICLQWHNCGALPYAEYRQLGFVFPAIKSTAYGVEHLVAASTGKRSTGARQKALPCHGVASPYICQSDSV